MEQIANNKTFKVLNVEHFEEFDGEDSEALQAVLCTKKGQIMVFEWASILEGTDSPETDGNMHMNQRQEIEDLFEGDVPWSEIHAAMTSALRSVKPT